MGLDIGFFKTESVGYFRKVNFILTYFDIDESKNCRYIGIGKNKFIEFIKDMSNELIRYNKHKAECGCDNPILEPLNQKLRTCEVFFGGSTEYDVVYWTDMECVHDWALNLMRTFNWDECGLIIQCWW